MAHIGSWGLPDFGITEGISNLLGGGRTSQGGSNIIQSSGLPTAQINTGTGFAPVQGPGLGWDIGSSPIPSPSNYSPTTNTNGQVPSGQATGGQVMGAQTSQQQGPSPEDQFRAQVESIFNPVFDALRGQMGTLESNYSTVPGEIQAQGDLSKQTVTDQYREGERGLVAQEEGLGQRKEDALTSATRLYNELQRGGQQRFGGSTSAGEAFGTLTDVEQQRRSGSIWQAFETGMQQVGTLKANLKDKFDTAVKEIALQTQEALNQAKRDFENARQSIRTMMGQAESDKASASLNLLQDFRNKVYTINQQQLQFVQQLALNNEATQKQVDDVANRVYESLLSGQNTLASNANTNYQATTSYGKAPTQNVSAPMAYTGQIKKDEELA
jgi:hypothetical protein